VVNVSYRNLDESFVVKNPEKPKKTKPGRQDRKRKKVRGKKLQKK